MKISCQACGTKYTIADDKVRGRKVRVRCKSCSTPIVVDTAQAVAEAQAEAAAGAPDTGAAADAAGDPWTVNLSDTEQRTMTTEEIVTGYHSGTVTDDAFVWKEGMEDWIPLLELPELRMAIEAYGTAAPAAPAAAQPMAAAAPAAPAFPAPAADPSPYAAEPPWAQPAATAAAAAVPAAAAPVASARLAGGRSHGAADLFGSVESAGSEEEALRTASLPGSTAYDAKVTGARNENSVLFSLDSLKAGFTAPKPPPPKTASAPKRPGRPGLQSQPDDPFGMSSGNSGMARLGGGGNPLFSMGDNQALMMAPPPPPEPPPPPVVTDPVSVEYAPAPAARRGSDKRIFILGGAAALVLMLGIGIAVALSGGKKEEAVAEADTKSESNKEADKADKKPDESKSENTEAKPDENKAEPAATAPSASAAEKKPPTEEEKRRFAEAQKKEQEKKEGDKAGEKKPELPVPTDGPQFNKGAAIAALSSAASASTSCKRPGGPTGSGKVLVTFAPSGRVTSANVAGGAFGGTPVGGCVASVFRRAKVPPFGGGPVTVSKSFSIKP